MKILIVDDNGNDRKLLLLNLKKHGCEEVIEACDGQQGLDLAREHRPDLIISDAMMPHLDGFEFLRSVKTDEQLKTIPFVFHSSVYTGLNDEELASRLGAEAFITKPKEPEEFWREIAAILSRLSTGEKKPLPAEPIEGENEYLREYSAIVGAKLEEKVKELEASLAQLQVAEDALRKSERFLNNIIENIPDMIFVKDAQELRFVLFNKAGEELLGYSRKELIGKNDHDFFPQNEADFFTDKDRETILNGRLVDIPEETISTRKSGNRILHTKKIPIQDETGTPQYLLGVSEDITEQKQAEETLLKLSAAIEQSPVSIVITDSKGNIEFVNPKFTQLTGYSSEEAIGQNPRFLKSGMTSPEDFRKLWETISSGHVWHGEFHNRKKNDEIFLESATIAPVKNRQGIITHYIAIKEDITERRSLENQLRQAQKIEAISTLAGGIAHDFNNILSVIIGFSSILEMKMSKDDPLLENVGQILIAADRAANLTKSMLAFSRKQTMEVNPVKLNEIIARVEKMLRRLIRENIELRLCLTDDDLTVLADAGQIEQVLLNLTTNAQDSMPARGDITITTELTELDKTFSRLFGYGEPGRYALITFVDTGEGMAESVRQKIFEPFFTTKEVGKGTGLGLSVCYGIIKQHNGYILCDSEPGRGTTFRIYLPINISSVLVNHAKESNLPENGTETILLAEDDISLRVLSTNILTEFGYTVIEAENGAEALSKFAERPDEIELCLFDVIMPKLSGFEAYEEIKRVRPNMKVLFMSGYQTDISSQYGIALANVNLITKPFSPLELLKRVREALDRCNS